MTDDSIERRRSLIRFAVGLAMCGLDDATIEGKCRARSFDSIAIAAISIFTSTAREQGDKAALELFEIVHEQIEQIVPPDQIGVWMPPN